MKSSKKLPDTTQARAPVAESAASYSSSTDRDPYEILDELMIVVEVLSPEWPARELSTVGSCFRL
jgi:hypothetical protein